MRCLARSVGFSANERSEMYRRGITSEREGWVCDDAAWRMAPRDGVVSSLDDDDASDWGADRGEGDVSRVGGVRVKPRREDDEPAEDELGWADDGLGEI